MGDFIVTYGSFIVINGISMEIYEFMGSLWESNMVWWCLMMFDGKPPPFHSMIFAFKPPFFFGISQLAVFSRFGPRNGPVGYPWAIGRMTTNLPYLGFYLWARCALDDPKSNLSRENIRGMFHTCVGLAEINSAANRGIVRSNPPKINYILLGSNQLHLGIIYLQVMINCDNQWWIVIKYD